MEEFRVTIVTFVEAESWEQVMKETKEQLPPEMNAEITVESNDY